MFHLTRIKTLTLVVLLIGLTLYACVGGYFARELVIQVATLAILAISLDMVAGYGGMVSLCHGAIFGVGAYTFAVVTVVAGGSPAVALLAAVLSASVFGALVGAIAARTQGIFFIMATLAFGQMAYVLVFHTRWLGGDDGMPGVPRLDLSAIGIDLQDSLQFVLVSLLCLALAFFIAAFILRSGFGRTISGIHANEGRMRALGIPVWKYKAAVFGLSAGLAGFAGALAAQHTFFVSPELMVWTVSGEALIIVILGGLATLVGPVVGATVLVFLKHAVSTITVHWHGIVGLALIVTVLAGGRGIYGQAEHLWHARGRKPGRDA